jgi:hypothetical protein
VEKKTNAAEWRKRIDSWETSGKTRSEFCREQGIRVSTFDYWRKKLKNGKKRIPGFVRVPVSLNDKNRAASFRIVIDGHYSVELCPGFQSDDLITVLRAIGTVSCS